MNSQYGMRTDCTRDNRQTILRNASLIGYSTNVAKRGSWVMFKHENGHHCGRVVGRVHCEGKTYLEVVAADFALTMAYVRWINPDSVLECYKTPHRQVINFLIGEWKDVDTILKTQYNGFVRVDEDQ